MGAFTPADNGVAQHGDGFKFAFQWFCHFPDLLIREPPRPSHDGAALALYLPRGTSLS